jgi:hypothetical protein
MVEFSPKHLYQIEPKNIFDKDPFMLNKAEAIATLEKCYGFTFFLGQEIIAIFGGALAWDGLFDVFAIISESIRKRPIEFHKRTLLIIEDFFNLLNLRRMQFIVRSDYCEGKRWAESLGFEKEATHKKYGPKGQDYDLFARFR